MIRSSILITFLSTFFVSGQVAPKPYGVLPSERQLKWHEMEMYCLIHFTPTTFQDKEWGYGDANPNIFNPQNFNADQIAKAAASAGFKGLISVAKHHDGFCLWPTKTTDYNIAQTPWKNGKGDMVKEFQDAAIKHRMKFCVYLSAWDRNDTRYGTSAYTDAYREQLTELMTNYGELFASWHDGANGGDGYYGGKNEKRTIDPVTYYEWFEKTWPIVRKLQPMANIFSDIGPDMRWVGNEHGFAAETSWSTITPIGKNGREAMPGSSDAVNLPSGDRNGKLWIPAECDVPQRPGWFYHTNHDTKVKTPNQLFEIYLKSVGRGGNMNLGLAPTPEGILHQNDVYSLEKFGEKIKKTFNTNLAKNAKLKASHERGSNKEFNVKNILDDDRYSYYAPNDEILTPTIELKLSGEKEFDIIQLKENIKLGQRLDSVKIEVLKDQQWQKIASATSIGANRIIKLDQPIKASQLRISLYAPVAPTLSDFGLFKEFDAPFEFPIKNNTLQKLNSNLFEVKTENLERAFDQNISTYSILNSSEKDIIIGLKSPISGLGYLPNKDQKEGLILSYEIVASDDAQKWTKVKEGEFSNIIANPIEQIILFEKPIKAKFIKFIPKKMVGNTIHISEINLYQ